jgi:hypothetical protein
LSQSKKEIKIKENDPGDSRSLYDLLDFIEGNDNINKDEKKVAKKARQKMKKVAVVQQSKLYLTMFFNLVPRCRKRAACGTLV